VAAILNRPNKKYTRLMVGSEIPMSSATTLNLLLNQKEISLHGLLVLEKDILNFGKESMSMSDFTGMKEGPFGTLTRANSDACPDQPLASVRCVTQPVQGSNLAGSVSLNNSETAVRTSSNPAS
jgi:hypothetical protein